MPLYKSVSLYPDTELLVWKITESYSDLFSAVSLKKNCLDRLEGMKSELHRKGFLSVRMLLQEAGYTDFDLFYGDDGKPHLTDNKYISITHSHNFSAIVISDRNVGIDIEKQRNKITIIADKFCISEFDYLNPADKVTFIKQLTAIWGVKESLFKILSVPGISFKNHINVASFSLTDGNGNATLKLDKKFYKYNFFFEEIEDFTLVYSFESSNQANRKLWQK